MTSAAPRIKHVRFMGRLLQFAQILTLYRRAQHTKERSEDRRHYFPVVDATKMANDHSDTGPPGEAEGDSAEPQVPILQLIRH